jgi:DNA-binding transcriptional LysR family regulator
MPGLELIKAAQPIFDSCAVAEQVMRRFRENWIGRVHVSTSLTAMIYRLPPVLRKLRNDYPGVDVILTNMPTPQSIAKLLDNEVDLGLVILPVEHNELRITPLCREPMLAVFPASEKGIPDEVTPDYIARQRLLLLTEQSPSAGHTMVMKWAHGGTATMPVGTVEALKSAVASNVGMAILPEVAVHANMTNVIVRPLRPPLESVLALIEHRNKPNGPALEIVRKALLELAIPRSAEIKARNRPTKTPESGRSGSKASLRRTSS